MQFQSIFAKLFLVCVRDDLCSFSSGKLFFLHTHESNLNQTKTDHPSFPLNILLDPAETARLADSTDQTWTCCSVRPAPAGRGPRAVPGLQAHRGPAVPISADLHTVRTLSPSDNGAHSPTKQHTARPVEPSGHQRRPGVSLPARSLRTKPGPLLSQAQPWSSGQPSSSTACQGAERRNEFHSREDPGQGWQQARNARNKREMTTETD